MTKQVFLDPTRPGTLCEPCPSGGFHSWPATNRPSILWNHIDGPLLIFRNGELHWLTLTERLRCWLGFDNAHSLEQKHRPHLAASPLPPIGGEGMSGCND